MLSPSHEQKPEPPLKPGQRPAYRGCRYSQFLCSRAQTAALSGKCEHSDVIKIEQSAHVYSLCQFASRAPKFRAKVYGILKSADVKCRTGYLVCSHTKAVCSSATYSTISRPGPHVVHKQPYVDFFQCSPEGWGCTENPRPVDLAGKNESYMTRRSLPWARPIRLQQLHQLLSFLCVFSNLGNLLFAQR